MARPLKSDGKDYSDAQRQGAEYIADILLGLRNVAKQNDLVFVVHLLEMAFYESFTIAHQAEPDLRAIESGTQMSDIT
jgi:hypothetical protein